MTPIFSALPWLKLASLFGAKDASLRSSRPSANLMVGSEQLPKSRAACLLRRRSFRYLQASSWASLDEVAGAVLLENGASAPDISSELREALPVPIETAADKGLASDAEDPAGASVPATAASISSAVASSTSRFWVKMQPGSSSRVLQELPAAVGSSTSPRAKVPDLRAA